MLTWWKGTMLAIAVLVLGIWWACSLLQDDAPGSSVVGGVGIFVAGIWYGSARKERT